MWYCLLDVFRMVCKVVVIDFLLLVLVIWMIGGRCCFGDFSVVSSWCMCLRERLIFFGWSVRSWLRILVI